MVEVSGSSPLGPTICAVAFHSTSRRRLAVRVMSSLRRGADVPDVVHYCVLAGLGSPVGVLRPPAVHLKPPLEPALMKDRAELGDVVDTLTARQVPGSAGARRSGRASAWNPRRRTGHSRSGPRRASRSRSSGRPRAPLSTSKCDGSKIALNSSIPTAAKSLR